MMSPTSGIITDFAAPTTTTTTGTTGTTTTTKTGGIWDFLIEIVKAVPGTVAASKGTTPVTPPASTGGVVTGNVTVDSILSNLGLQPKITGVTVSIPKWVYFVMIAAAIMIFYPFVKSLIRRR